MYPHMGPSSPTCMGGSVSEIDEGFSLAESMM